MTTITERPPLMIADAAITAIPKAEGGHRYVFAAQVKRQGDTEWQEFQRDLTDDEVAALSGRFLPGQWAEALAALIEGDAA
jgi:hypothetical protein